MVVDDVLFFRVISDTTMTVAYPVDADLSPPNVYSHVEELGVCISLLEVCNASTLPFACPLQHRQANHTSF